MKKKNFFFLFVLLLLVAMGIWLWNHNGKPAEQTPLQATTSPLTVQSNQVVTNSKTSNVPKDVPTGRDAVAYVIKKQLQSAASATQGSDEWRTPIEFYGKVVDEKGQPVAGAKVDFSCNDLSAEGTSFYHKTSAEDGGFSILGINGKLLTVSVSKEGYYTSKKDTTAFYYAGQNVNFSPDAANPVVFHLRSKGEAASLVHYKNSFRIPRDGTPVEFSLKTGEKTPAGQGDVIVECWTHDEKPAQKYDWKCVVTVRNGGILPYAEEFPFQAPPNGYQPSDEINMPASLNKAWSYDVKKNYFLQLSNGNFARMSFEMVAGGDNFFLMESFLNPSGSTNLEPTN